MLNCLKGDKEQGQRWDSNSDRLVPNTCFFTIPQDPLSQSKVSNHSHMVDKSTLTVPRSTGDFYPLPLILLPHLL